ncbi:MAG: polymerase subunit alpha [Bacteroidetes bacterium]|nr:polymerase subunit alpha [Bacteroidota bacterium]
MLLNCHTYYSFCYGTFSPKHLMDEVKQKGYSSFVLTDINNTSACLETIRIAKKDFGLDVIAGIDFRNGPEQKYVGIAMNNEGFRELNAHLSEHLHNGEKFEETAPSFNNAFVIYPAAAYKGWELKEHEYIGVATGELPQLQFLPARHQKNKLVALQPVTFPDKKHFNAHRLLRAIDTNTLLSKLSPKEQAAQDATMMYKKEMHAAYAFYPGIIPNTERLLSACSIGFQYDKKVSKNLKHYTGTAQGDIELLRSECEKGLEYRFGKPSAIVLERMKKELDIIFQKNFASYFLINMDIVRYAERRGYYHVGRGSGANSLLAYLLKITDVDPIELDLYFERFINLYRANAPDFDIDFSWTDRDDMTRYIFDRFGKDENGKPNHRTALMGAYNTFQHDAVVRELGKVFGLPAGEIDKLQSAGKSPANNELGRLVLRYSEVLKGFPSHLSVHSSGIIISEEPIHCYSATHLPPKGYPTTQFSMLEAEDIGLYKFDILSQRGLGKIKDSLEIIQKNKGLAIDIHDVEKFKADEEVKKLLREATAIGCFYVESPAMRMLLAKLRADDYLRLVAASSIIRPGVAKSGMMREYIVRFRDEGVREKARAKLPELYELMEETYGVMVYQEDVIKVAHVFAGLSLAEADFLRRGMSWKFKERNEFWKVKQQFFDNCKAKNHNEKVVHETWTQIESFANFAFSKGHSASYAVESYQALYLKAYYPLEYMVATLNNGGGFYRKEIYIHEARMHGATIEKPCINNSDGLCAIKDKTIYLGLNMIAELEQQLIPEIIQERKQNGPFSGLHDFVKRVPVSIEQMRLLIRAGTFQFTGRNKKELLWEIHSLINPLKKKEAAKELFDVAPKTWQLPELSDSWLDDTFDEQELFGFTLCSPFDLLREPVTSNVKAKELRQRVGETLSIPGYLVTVKTTNTTKGERMCFGTFLDTDGHWIDTVHFPPSLKTHPFSGPGCYMLTGKVTEEYDFCTLEVNGMKRLAVIDRENMSLPSLFSSTK